VPLVRGFQGCIITSVGKSTQSSRQAGRSGSNLNTLVKSIGGRPKDPNQVLSNPCNAADGIDVI